MATNNILTGKVKFFNTEKAFGFIIPDHGGQEIFFHVSGVQGNAKPEKNDSVQYEPAHSKNGPKAINIVVI